MDWWIDGTPRLKHAAIAASEERAAERGHGLQTEILRGLEALARGNFARVNSLERVFYLETRRPPQ